MLGTLINVLIGIAIGYGIQEIIKMYEKKGAFKGFQLIKNAKKEGKKIFLCETKNAFWCYQEKASYHNLSLTENKDIIIVAPNSVKPAYGLGGVMLGIADLYRACTIPQELRQTVVFLKLIGLSEKDITDYLTLIHGGKISEKIDGKTPEEQAENFLMKKIDELIEKTKDNKKRELLKIIKEKKEIYLSTPSTIVEFLQTGLNRVTLKMQMKQIIDEKILEQIRKKDWISIALAVFIIALAVWFVLGGGLGNLISSFIGTTQTVPTPR